MFKVNKFITNFIKILYWIYSIFLVHTFLWLSQFRFWFPTSYVMVFFVFSHCRWEVIVLFVDISEIIDHHCLNFLFIICLTPREPRGIEMGSRASSAWRGVRQLCGMYKFTTNPSFGRDVNKTEVLCWEIATLFAR